VINARHCCGNVARLLALQHRQRGDVLQPRARDADLSGGGKSRGQGSVEHFFRVGLRVAGNIRFQARHARRDLCREIGVVFAGINIEQRVVQLRLNAVEIVAQRGAQRGGQCQGGQQPHGANNFLENAIHFKFCRELFLCRNINGGERGLFGNVRIQNGGHLA
jgi:hypothetical protein